MGVESEGLGELPVKEERAHSVRAEVSVSGTQQEAALGALRDRLMGEAGGCS